MLLDLESLTDESMSQAIELGRMVRNSALVILTDDPENFSAADALRSGVRAILPREATSEEIVVAIQASVVGLVVLHPDALHSVLSPIPSGDQPRLILRIRFLPRERSKCCA